jgi:hypothetical protein
LSMQPLKQIVRRVGRIQDPPVRREHEKTSRRGSAVWFLPCAIVMSTSCSLFMEFQGIGRLAVHA